MTFNFKNSILLLNFMCCFFISSIHAKVQLMPLKKINDGYLVLQGDKVPVFNSIKDGKACLFDKQWCNSSDPKLPLTYRYDGGLNEDLLLVIIDSQLVMIRKDEIIPSDGLFKLSNIEGYFTLTYHRLGSSLGNLQSLPFQTSAYRNLEIDRETIYIHSTQSVDGNPIDYDGPYRVTFLSNSIDGLSLLQIIAFMEEEFKKRSTFLEFDNIVIEEDPTRF